MQASLVKLESPPSSEHLLPDTSSGHLLGGGHHHLGATHHHMMSWGTTTTSASPGATGGYPKVEIAQPQTSSGSIKGKSSFLFLTLSSSSVRVSVFD